MDLPPPPPLALWLSQAPLEAPRTLLPASGWGTGPQTLGDGNGEGWGGLGWVGLGWGGLGWVGVEDVKRNKVSIRWEGQLLLVYCTYMNDQLTYCIFQDYS